MKKIFFFIFFVIIYSLFLSAHAQTIIWVSEWNEDANGIPFDQDWIELLEAQGYDVIADTTGTYEVLNTAKMNALDAADLVIFSRNTNSINYIDGGEITQWNSINTPLILLNAYLARRNRWQWINSNQSYEFTKEEMMEIVDEGHDIFDGISATNGQVDMIDETINEGDVTFLASETAGNGKILARRAGDNYVWITKWEAGIKFYPGTSQKPVEKRLLFVAGGSAAQESGSLNLTETGKLIFLNAVNYMLGAAKKAGVYYPLNNAQNIENNPILSWIPGVYANTHNVFFGTDFDDVNEATINNPLDTITSIGQAADSNTFIPGALEFGKTYYWRIDEVNEPGSPGEYKGHIWSFTVESVALKLPYESILKVTAISSYRNNDPNDTVNENGLDPNNPDQHSKSSGSWASSGDDTNNVWIQYDFDKQYKIHEMMVWNYNHIINKTYGFREVLIEYSEDGSDTWIELPGVNEFNKATGKDDYEYNTIVPFNDVVAKSVRITALTSWGSAKGLGLSEVRFMYIPVRARIPSPCDETTGVDVETTLTWRKGREAVTHTVYIDTDKAAVINDTASSYTTSVNSYSPALALGRTYYWRVDEINNSMTPSVWKSDVWSFSTVSGILIDNFETGYGNTAADAVYKTWKDGVEAGNPANGSYMGRSSPPYLHTINHSGGYSAPMTYDTLTHTYSEVIAQSVDLPIGTSNWSIGLPATLTIWFRGDPNTTEAGDSELYCKIGGKTAVYGGSIDALTRDMWRQWDIDLEDLSANLSSIPEITIGIRKIGSKGGSGVIYLDDISLTGNVPLIAYPDVFIEAENYKSISSPMEVNDVVEGASGGQYIHVEEGTTASWSNPPANGIATYEVTLDGGQYVIYGRVSIAAFNQDAFWVKVDGAAYDQELHSSGWCRWNMIPFGAAWHWDDVHSTQNDNSNPVVTWTIPAGKTTIKIAYRDTDVMNPPRLDALLIVKVSD